MPGDGSRMRSANKERVVIVDDDPDIRALAGAALQQAGYAVTELGDGQRLMQVLDSRDVAAVVLDLGLPGRSGLDLLGDVRARSPIPILILTARGDEADRVVGLELGADDYIVKPFFPRELVARVRSVLRRLNTGDGQAMELSSGSLTFDISAREVMLDGEPLELTALEFDLLAHLAAHPRQVFTRDQLLEQVWGSTSDWQSPATVNEHVYRLRQKLVASSGAPRIVTMRGVGYRYEP